MKRVIVVAGLAASAGVWLWFFPLFHVVSVERREAERREAEFNTAEFAGRFWTEQLLPSLDQAADAAAVLAAIRQDPRQAREQFGRSAGMGRSYHYFLRGSGTVVAVERSGVGVSLSGEAAEPDLLLRTGPLFGNAIRNATGLIRASDFPNSQHYNDISTELNRLAEARVIPVLEREAAVGRTVQFVGCAEVAGERADRKPLQLIPIEVKIE